MENKIGLWKTKYSETSPAETENFGSISSTSQRYSDDNKDKAQPNNDGISSLTTKLSAALVNVRSKEDLVKQHSEVAEQAIASWEKAENEVVILKQKLEGVVKQNSALEDRVSRLDGALKECVKQLIQARELERRLLEFQDKAESWHKIEALEKENSALKLELSLYLEEMEIRTIERDLTNEVAEIASKQYLESIKKVAKLEDEYRRLKAIGVKSCFVNAEKSPPSSTSVESFTDSQSDLWPSTLIAELDLMDDFLEMERLAALSKTESKNQCLEPQVTVKESNDGDGLLKAELEAMIHRTSELEEKLEKLEVEKAELETALAESQESLEASDLQLRGTKTKLAELRTELCMANEAKQHLESQLGIMETDAETMSAKIDSLVAEIETERTLSEQVSVKANESKQVLESKLISIEAKARMMSAKIESLETEVEKERALSEQVSVNANESKQLLESKLISIEAEARMISAKIDSLEEEIEKERKVSANAKESNQLLESQLISIKAEARMMSAKINSLEKEIQKERTLSEQVSIKANESKQLLETQLIIIEAEARMMSAKIDLLETEVEKEKALSSKISVKCRELEEELSIKRHEAELQQTANSNVESKIKQEDLVVAAEKLAECQKTIASLGNQLKSLATLEDLLIDTTASIPAREPESPRVSADCYGHTVNKVRNTPPSSSSSSNHGSSEKNRNGFATFLIRSKNGIQLEI